MNKFQVRLVAEHNAIKQWASRTRQHCGCKTIYGPPFDMDDGSGSNAAASDTFVSVVDFIDFALLGPTTRWSICVCSMFQAHWSMEVSADFSLRVLLVSTSLLWRLDPALKVGFPANTRCYSLARALYLEVGMES